MTPHNGRTPTAMAVVTIQMDSMAMHSGKTPTNGKTAMAMATVTISSTKTAMVVSEGYSDVCPLVFGKSTDALTRGCSDYDGDGFVDPVDAFWEDPFQWADR